MHNAKYHKDKPSTTPKGNWKKSHLYQACLNYNIEDIKMDDYKSTIWSRLQEHVDQFVLPVVVEMARARGHDVVYTPPGFSELQPIEMIWANVKGKVGRAYTSDTTFSEVRQRLDDAFWDLDEFTIHDTIENSTAYLVALDKKLREADANDASGGDAFYDSDLDSLASGDDDSNEISDSSGNNNDDDA
ncbi:unnamed protein product [Aphanomyces euteiches]|uniref:Tc1-like transposase DDE domain-containing protein n=1 Tax=Aphanomyces euteiches TaxID=100861 RepID=A0A6G0W5P2_9STRA|nr:hypothetical protein Ae201684_018484 [Aphanomyces euteiches]KAH9072647.1 hypothetical protein Ae201684P_015720 [Aphanomyces euteiches]KAH9144540.1 hypothetical protein AeRB84_011511 [Aphanomyces euteiches]